MGEVYSLSKVRRRSAAPPLQMPESLLVCAATFGFVLPSAFSQYCLRRSKAGVYVFIKGDRLTLNLSVAAKIFPTTFKEARRWIAAVADRQGWQLTETKSMHMRNTKEAPATARVPAGNSSDGEGGNRQPSFPRPRT